MSSVWMAAVTALWAVVSVLVIVIVGLFRRIGNVLERAEAQLAAREEAESGAPVMSTVAEFSLYDANGVLVTSEELLVEPTLLVFMEPNCQPCRQLALELEGVGETVDGVPLLVVLSDSPEAHAMALPPNLRILYQRRGEVSEAFQNTATPQAFAVDVGGLVLDRRAPRFLSDMRMMAWWQREGGSATAEGVGAGA